MKSRPENTACVAEAMVENTSITYSPAYKMREKGRKKDKQISVESHKRRKGDGRKERRKKIIEEKRREEKERKRGEGYDRVCDNSIAGSRIKNKLETRSSATSKIHILSYHFIASKPI
jgi:hypothetical protein